MSAETEDGVNSTKLQQGKLVKVFLINTNIIADKEMVALEVKYHKSCYEKYALHVPLTQHATGEENEEQVYKYEKSFDVFCKDIIIITQES